MPNAVGVDYPKPKLPTEEVGFLGLSNVSAPSNPSKWFYPRSKISYLYIYPLLLLEGQQFLHKPLLRHGAMPGPYGASEVRGQQRMTASEGHNGL